MHLLLSLLLLKHHGRPRGLLLLQACPSHAAAPACSLLQPLKHVLPLLQLLLLLTTIDAAACCSRSRSGRHLELLLLQKSTLVGAGAAAHGRRHGLNLQGMEGGGRQEMCEALHFRNHAADCIVTIQLHCIPIPHPDYEIKAHTHTHLLQLLRGHPSGHTASAPARLLLLLLLHPSASSATATRRCVLRDGCHRRHRLMLLHHVRRLLLLLPPGRCHRPALAQRSGHSGKASMVRHGASSSSSSTLLLPLSLLLLLPGGSLPLPLLQVERKCSLWLLPPSSPSLQLLLLPLLPGARGRSAPSSSSSVGRGSALPLTLALSLLLLLLLGGRGLCGDDLEGSQHAALVGLQHSLLNLQKGRGGEGSGGGRGGRGGGERRSEGGEGGSPWA